jgi:hypothetical protein
MGSMNVHEFRSKRQNDARDAILDRLSKGQAATRELIMIGVRNGLYEGETMGMLSTLKKTGAIESPRLGWRKLAGR